MGKLIAIDRPAEELKDSGVAWIGDVPKDWESHSLSTLVDIINGYSFKSTEYTDDGINIMRITNVDDGKLNKNNPRFYPESRAGEFKKYLLKVDDILMSLTGNVGLVGVITSEYMPSALNQRVASLRIKKDIKYKYLFYYLYTKEFERNSIENSSGTAQLNMSTTWLGSVKLHTAGIREQEIIAEYLDKQVSTIDKSISSSEKLIEDLKLYKRAIITEAVTKGLDPTVPMKDSGVEWIGEIPAHWEVKKLGSITRCLDGKRRPVSADKREPGPYPYWGGGSITDYVADYLFDEEIILLGEDGSPFFDPFRPVAHLVNEKVWVNNHIHVLKALDNADSSFLANALNSVNYKDYITGSIIPKLNQSKMNDIDIPLAPLYEQQNIAKHINTNTTKIDDQLKHIESVIEKLKFYKKSLIFECVTGKKKVIEVED